MLFSMFSVGAIATSVIVKMLGKTYVEVGKSMVDDTF